MERSLYNITGKRSKTMRNCLKKQLSLLLSLCLLAGVMSPCTIYAADETLSVTLSTPYLVKSDQAQTVEMYVRLPAGSRCKSFGYYIVNSSPVVATAATKGDDDQISGSKPCIVDTVADEDRTADYVNLGTVTYTVPAGTEGTFQLGVSDVELRNGTDSYLEGGAQAVTLTVYRDASQLPSQGRTAVLSGPANGTVGDTLTYQVTVTGDSFAAAQMALTYDNAKLEFVTGNGPEVTASGNTLTVADFGSTKTMPYTYELKFTAKAAGTAAVTLKSAAFGTRESAVSQDLTAAALNGDPVTTVIEKKTHAVTLPSFFTGNSVANDGEAYTFHPVDSNPAHYSYTAVAATVSGTAAAVTVNGDGSYTVNNVTGPLTVTAVQTPKSYSVTFQTNTGVELPANGTADYGTDYTFTMPKREHYATSIQSATINGIAIPCSISETGHVTIDGARIEGNIVIVIQQVQTESPVSVIGSGAGEAAGYVPHAAVGSSYTLTLTRDSKYDYTVTATIAGQPVTLQTDGSRYTIQNVTAGEIVFNVNRSLKTQGMSAGRYLNLNGTSVWLVKNAVDRLEGSTYTYDGTRMYWSGKYSAYCCLVIGAAAPAITADRLAIAGGATQEVVYSGDVNLTGTVDANDAQLVYNLYNVSYDDFSIVSMEKYLRADVNGSGNVDINDAAAVIAAILRY